MQTDCGCMFYEPGCHNYPKFHPKKANSRPVRLTKAGYSVPNIELCIAYKAKTALDAIDSIYLTVSS